MASPEKTRTEEFPKDFKLSSMLAQKAKKEMLETGVIKTQCPKCGSLATVEIVGLYGETIYIRCKCGFLSCTEHGI